MLETTLSPPPAGSSDRDQPLSPRGSVALGLDLPIEPGWLGWGAASVSADQERGASPPEEPHDPSDPVDDDDDPGDPEHHLDRLRDGLPQALGDLLSDVLAEGADDDEASDGPTDPGERRGLESSRPEAAADGGPGEELGRDPADLSELLAAFAQATGMGELLSGLQQAADASAGPLPPAPGEPTGSPADMAPADPGEDGGMPGESAGHGVPVGPRGRYALRSLPMARNGAGRIARRAVPDPTDVFQPAPASGLLPRDPWLLMLWLQGIERALARRLLQLSHAINREWLQAGLTRVLLPSDLLEAVLAGQIEGQSPQPNLLQLVLPLGFSAAGAALSSYAILLRCADLELDHPRLRTVRGRLQQRRRQTLRMAQRYQRLRRRLQTHEAQALWQEDIEATRRDRQGPTPKR